ncbi:HCCS [Cordylochernes scorpioides]|uniref:Holocytochrome c-type synthase n=1 Tax=Cordylochernes scorpioides TaxID=51811 RepID=A0ABY6K8W6_9ARAC|nr:HCCS [Cordylochernes scorpioides]
MLASFSRVECRGDESTPGPPLCTGGYPQVFPGRIFEDSPLGYGALLSRRSCVYNMSVQECSNCPQKPAESVAPATCPVTHEKAPSQCPKSSGGCSKKQESAGSSCPMKQDSAGKSCPMRQEAAPLTLWQRCKAAVMGPPAPQQQDGNCAVQDINLLNMMEHPNQQPAPDQPFPLSTHRQVSNIPRWDRDENWVYPSQQMFWNAMLRKGWRWKDDAVEQNDMDHIIRIHNANNEYAWEEILKWEALHCKECAEPKLVSFRGRAKDFTVRARIRQLLGYELPFDRHDWVVDRCGKKVRYILDYYDGGPVDSTTNRFTVIDVRPAPTSLGNILDRTKVMWWRWRYAENNKTETS